MNKLLFMINDNQKMINVKCFPPWLDQRQGFILAQNLSLRLAGTALNSDYSMVWLSKFWCHKTFSIHNLREEGWPMTLYYIAEIDAISDAVVNCELPTLDTVMQYY